MASAAEKILLAGFGTTLGQQGALFFRVGIDLGEINLLALLPPYNEFLGFKARDVVREMFRQDLVHLVEVGREYSPVIYAHAKSDKAAQKITLFFDTLNPDELDILPEHVVRAWWD